MGRASYREGGVVGAEVVPALVLQLLHHLVHRALQPRFHGDPGLPQQVQTSLCFHLHRLPLQRSKNAMIAHWTLLTNTDRIYWFVVVGMETAQQTNRNEMRVLIHLWDFIRFYFVWQIWSWSYKTLLWLFPASLCSRVCWIHVRRRSDILAVLVLFTFFSLYSSCDFYSVFGIIDRLENSWFAKLPEPGSHLFIQCCSYTNLHSHKYHLSHILLLFILIVKWLWPSRPGPCSPCWIPCEPNYSSWVSWCETKECAGETFNLIVLVNNGFLLLRLCKGRPHAKSDLSLKHQ